MRKKYVLFLIDFNDRDILPAVFLKYWLEKSPGVHVVFASRKTMGIQCLKYQPALVITSHIILIPHVKKKCSSKTRFALLPTEGAMFVKNIALANYLGLRKYTGPQDIDGSRIKDVEKIFLWGKKQKEWILEDSVIEEEKLFVGGNPRLDIYKLKKSNNDTDSSAKPVGILGMFNGLNIFDRRGMLRLIEAGRKEQGAYYANDRNIEDFYWYRIAVARTYFDIIEELNKKNMRVLYRPHPYEYKKSYQFFKRKYSNLEIDTSRMISDYLRKVSAAVFFNSTSVVESYLAGTPCISIEKMLGSRLDDHMTLAPFRNLLLDVVWRPESKEQLYEYIGKAQERDLPLLQDEEAFFEIGRDFFSIDLPELSSYLISQEILKLIEGKTYPCNPVLTAKGFLKEAAVLLKTLYSYSTGQLNYTIERNRHYWFWDKPFEQKLFNRIKDGIS